MLTSTYKLSQYLISPVEMKTEKHKCRTDTKQTNATMKKETFGAKCEKTTTLLHVLIMYQQNANLTETQCGTEYFDFLHTVQPVMNNHQWRTHSDFSRRVAWGVASSGFYGQSALTVTLVLSRL